MRYRIVRVEEGLQQNLHASYHLSEKRAAEVLQAVCDSATTTHVTIPVWHLRVLLAERKTLRKRIRSAIAALMK